jgi:hypothetical protein
LRGAGVEHDAQFFAPASSAHDRQERPDAL